MNITESKTKRSRAAKGKSEEVSVLKTEAVDNSTIYKSMTERLIEIALDKNLDLDRLERLLAMKKQEDENWAKRDFYKAFTKFQHAVPVMIKNRNVGYDHKDGSGRTEYNYLDLAGIESFIKRPLFENGLSYNWTQREDGNQIIVTCSIRHIGGHIEQGLPLSGQADASGKKNMIQQKASTITYLKRYTLLGILGLSSAEDDNDGQGGGAAGKYEKKEVVSTKIILTDEQTKNAVSQILKGKKTLEDIQKQVELSESQLATLVIAQDQYANSAKQK